MAKHITMSKHYKCGASRQACVRQSLDRVSHDPAQGKKTVSMAKWKPMLVAEPTQFGEFSEFS